MRGAAGIQFGSKYLSLALQLLITMALARLISPDDFGVLAIVVVFLAFFNMFANMGIGTAIVQFRDLTERDHGALFMFTFLVAIILSAAFCAASPLISAIYGRAELVPLCCLGSLSLFFSTLNTVPNGVLLRDKDFIAIGIRQVVTTIAAGVAAILLSLLGWGAYALVLQSAIQAAAVLAWNLIRHPIRQLNWHFIAPLKKVFSYSAYQLGFSVINYFSRNLDNLLIGGFMGATSLGYYDRAYKLTTYPMTAISSVAASVVQPYMAEHQNNPKRIFEAWLKITKLISLVAAPIAVLFFCSATEIIAILFGDQWDASVPLFQALAISVYFQMVNNTSGSFYQSSGRTDLLFTNGLIDTAITAIAIMAGVLSGDLLVVAILVSIAYCLHTLPVMLLLVRKALGEPLQSLLLFVPEVLIALVSGAICSALGAVIPSLGAIDIVWKIACIAIVVGVGYKATGQFGHIAAALGRSAD